MVVLLSGTAFMLVLLPLMFIQSFYISLGWNPRRQPAPRASFRPTAQRHVLRMGLSCMEQSLVRLLKRSHIDYAVLIPDLAEALLRHDEGYQVMVGGVDDPTTYARARASQAAIVATARTDTTNTNVAFTVREISEQVAIVATASAAASVEVLELAGCNQVLQLGEMLGQSLARRVLGLNASSHVIGQFNELLIAEAAAASTPLVGRMLKDIRLRDHANVNVVGVWNRGKFEIVGPNTTIHATSILVLAGTREQLDNYDGLFCIYSPKEAPVVILGGGRMGRGILYSHFEKLESFSTTFDI